MFPHRWAWIALTAYIVQSGNRGRLDVAYKSVLLGGAAAGTLVAMLASTYFASHGVPVISALLASVFFAIWLRPIGYACWALFVTVALRLLQGFGDG